ncbi:hypothetical protein QVD17_02774 [Tagetes erecta]|uniref:S-protein homolog n=1 Tax=Tagetes erecta TaxID=13708 RepID=A0AAD8LGA8_TARER|nr:hypothetical protein QVD17_02774 [Tagetes erecta]
MGKLLYFFILSLNLFDAPYENVVRDHDNINCLTFKCTVHIMSNVNNLRFRCHSRDDDLGDVTRNAGEEFDIRFCLHFFGRSRFSCHFYLDSKQQEFNVYELAPIFETQPYCFEGYDNLECYWKVEKDGFYIPRIFQPQPSDWVKVYDWK